MSVIEEVARHRNDVKTDSFTTTINDLLDMYRRGDLKIDPEYQRLFRWDLDRQSEYIESLLLSIPTPPLFLATNADGKHEVIDGLQRLSTLIKFFSIEVFPDSATEATEETNDSEKNNLSVSTLLVEAPIIESIAGYTVKTLPGSLTRALRYTRIPIIVLEKESSINARYHVFRRLNRSGSVLSDQEVRNCTARLFGNDFPALLKELGETDQVRTALSLQDEQEKRMLAEELILRVLANAHSPKRFKHSLVEFLDEFMDLAAQGKFKAPPEMQKNVAGTFQAISEVFQNGEAFRSWRDGRPVGPFSPNLFDIIATGIYLNFDKISTKRNTAWLKERITSLNGNRKNYEDIVGAGSNTRKKHEARINLGKSWFEP